MSAETMPTNHVETVNGYDIFLTAPGSSKVNIWADGVGWWGFNLTLEGARRICNAVPAHIKHVDAEISKGIADSFDTVYCRKCGPRSKSQGQAEQAIKDETCVYVCAKCKETCDEIPF